MAFGYASPALRRQRLDGAWVVFAMKFKTLGYECFLREV